MEYSVFELKKLLLKYKRDIDELIIVCNKKNDTIVNSNYKNASIETEFLNEQEYEQLYNMAYAQGIPFDVFTSEIDFIKCILNNYENLLNKKIVVYNSAQNGTGAGRKSLIPAFCNLLQLKCTGSDAYRVSLCRDKFAINSILKANKICVPRSFLFNSNSTQIVLPNGKYLIKPLYESASIGITNENIFYSNNIPYNYLNDLSKKMNQPLMLQQFINGYEFEVPILRKNEDILIFDPVILSSDEKNLCMGDKILDYEKIYYDNYYFSDMPDEIHPFLSEIREAAKQVVELLGLNGLCRVDGRITHNGNYYITDVSTNPHFVQHSSVNYAFKRNHYEDCDIFTSIIYLC